MHVTVLCWCLPVRLLAMYVTRTYIGKQTHGQAPAPGDLSRTLAIVVASCTLLLSDSVHGDVCRLSRGRMPLVLTCACCVSRFMVTYVTCLHGDVCHLSPWAQGGFMVTYVTCTGRLGDVCCFSKGGFMVTYVTCPLGQTHMVTYVTCTGFRAMYVACPKKGV